MSSLDWNPEDFSEIPYAFYSDDGIYRRELKRVFQGETWNFLALECEIPNAGDYKTATVGEVPVIAVRDEAGAVNAMVNRCAHRGNLVCIDEAGNAERLTCVYHNWTYDLRGNLASIAFEKGIRGKGGMAEDFDRSRRGLRRLRVETYRGLVFGSFSADAPPLADYLGPEMRANIDRGSRTRDGDSRQVPARARRQLEALHRERARHLSRERFSIPFSRPSGSTACR